MDPDRPPIPLVQIANNKFLVDELLDNTRRGARRDKHLLRKVLHWKTTVTDDLQRVILGCRQAECDALVLDLQMAIGKQRVKNFRQTRRRVIEWLQRAGCGTYLSMGSGIDLRSVVPPGKLAFGIHVGPRRLESVYPIRNLLVFLARNPCHPGAADLSRPHSPCPPCPLRLQALKARFRATCGLVPRDAEWGTFHAGRTGG